MLCTARETWGKSSGKVSVSDSLVCWSLGWHWPGGSTSVRPGVKGDELASPRPRLLPPHRVTQRPQPPGPVIPPACNPDPLSTCPHTVFPTPTALGTPVPIPSVCAFPHAVPSVWNGLLLIYSQGNSCSFLVPCHTVSSGSPPSALPDQQLVKVCASALPFSAEQVPFLLAWCRDHGLAPCGPACLAHHGQHGMWNGLAVSALADASGTSWAS